MHILFTFLGSNIRCHTRLAKYRNLQKQVELLAESSESSEFESGFFLAAMEMPLNCEKNELEAVDQMNIEVEVL